MLLWRRGQGISEQKANCWSYGREFKRFGTRVDGIHEHTHTHTNTNIQTHIRTYLHTYGHSHSHANILTHTRTYSHTYGHTHSHANILTRARTYLHTHEHIHTHTNILTHTRTYAHKHTHTYTNILTHTKIFNITDISYRNVENVEFIKHFCIILFPFFLGYIHFLFFLILEGGGGSEVLSMPHPECASDIVDLQPGGRGRLTHSNLMIPTPLDSLLNQRRSLYLYTSA